MAVLCAVLVPAGLAFAGYQDGGYGGATDQLEALSFRVGDAKVKRLSTSVYAECGEGPRQLITIEKGRTDVLDDRFTLELTGPNELEVTVTGRLKGERASGRIEASVKPAGSVCRADLKWQATLAGTAVIKP